jgi:heptaprenyl diphosphate synthase
MKDIKKMTLYANLLAIAIILNIVESLWQVIPVPGAKIGLANIVTVIILFIYKPSDSIYFVIIRVIFVSILTGKLFNPIFYMSLSGGIFASVSMVILFKLDFFGLLGISVLGSIMHTVGQIIMGIFVVGSVAVISYLPIMLLISVPAGIVTGIVSKRFLVAFKRIQ